MMTIASSLGDYQVEFHLDLDFFKGLQAMPGSVFLFDARVWELYARRLEAHLDPARIRTFAVGEEVKNLGGVESIYDLLLGQGVRRGATLVAVGGGVLQDLAGFSASTLFRGLPWVFVPTTLLAQGDSCIGGKTSLNHRSAKNLLGTFWPPRQVHVSSAFLPTLSREDFFSGLGEALKLHLIGGARDTAAYRAAQAALHARDDQATLAVVRRALEIKKGYIEQDEFDGAARLLLNYGHCFGHALESTSGFRIPHGQAVVAGMMLANAVSLRRGLLPEAEAEAVQALLHDGLVTPPVLPELEPGALVKAIGSDKKRTGKGLAVILLQAGHRLAQHQDMTPEEVAWAVQSTRF
jgi:3-dehydroquinate synthase